MGNQCFSTNPFRNYANQLHQIGLLQLKNQWPTISSFKIKRIFQRLSNNANNKQQAYLSLSAFSQMFPQFIRYEEAQKQRIYKIFDRSDNGYVNWIDFYDSISICYFADQNMMATIMFMIFDQLLEKQLSISQLTLLVELNAIFIRDGSDNGSILEMDPQEIVMKLLGQSNSISLQKWLNKSGYFFDFNQFRRLFNIFKQQKLQKQLVQNFSDWNQLYDEEQKKYISYVISFKWFQAWRAYVQNQYGISFSVEDKNPATLKSIRTKKSLKTSNSRKSKKHLTQHFSSALRLRLENLQQNDSIIDSKNKTVQQVKNFDMIRSNIGQRPKRIYNNFLQGEYAGTIKTDIVENRDYVLVSQKVWNYLTQIYSGQPQFRRTGFDQIQLSPKIIRIYSGMFNNQINYSSQIVRQASNTTKIQDLITKLLEIDKQRLGQLSIFYRTLGVGLWQQIVDTSCALIELTTNTIILLVYVQKKTTQQKLFKLKYLNIPKNIKQCNLGDSLIYQNTVNKIQKQVIFYNRTVQGKYIVHFVGQSYTNDLCFDQKQFYKCCKISSIPQQIVQSNCKNYKFDKRRRGIQGAKNLSFITSIILQFLESFNLKQILTFLPNNNQLQNNKQVLQSQNKQKQQKTYLSVILAYISRLIKANMHVDPRDIIIMVDLFFPQFRNFDITQINMFIDTYCEKVKQDAKLLKFPDIITDDIQFNICSKIKCLKCGCLSEEQIENQHVLRVKIPQPSQAYYQVIVVPFCITMTNNPIKKYGFQLPRTTTLKDYKNKLVNVAHLQNKNYILLEIQGNTIIKNYNHIRDLSVTLQNLRLREDDNIYAFQICNDFSIFVNNHFSFSQNDHSEIEQKDLKVGDMIDCRSPQKGWIFGKIVDKDIMPYTYQQNLKVLHKVKNMDQHLYSYKIIKNVVALFPSQSYKNCDQYHLRLIQRVFSEANNEMVVCNMPLVIVLPNWMRPKQFQYLVYLQIQRFIALNYTFQSQEFSSNILGSNSIQNNLIRQSTKKKVKKFKQYLYGKSLPYKLNFIDHSGHCLICFKFVKSYIFKGQSQNYCDGCNLKNDEPVSWQITMNDLVISVDWKNVWSFRKDVIKNDSSYISLSMKRKKDIETIESCLEETLSQSTQIMEMLCCNMPVKALVSKFLTDLPNFLIVSLDRIVQQNGFKKKIRRPVYFGDQNITVQGQQYRLVGVIGSKGHQNNISYTNYIKQFRQGEISRWLAYNGERVQIIRKQQIDKNCTHVFFYEKINKTQKILKTQKNFSGIEQIQQIQNQKMLTRHSSKKCSEKAEKLQKKSQNYSNKLIQKSIKQFTNFLEEEEQQQNIKDQNYQQNDIRYDKSIGLNVGLLKIPDDDFNLSQKNLNL